MEPVLLLHARGAIYDIVANLCEVSAAMGYSLRSLRGDPCSPAAKLPTIAKRISILKTDDLPADQIQDAQVIGTVHIVRTSHIPLECRISFHLEDLCGDALPKADQQSLQRFCAKSYMLLESRQLLIEANDTKPGTGPFRLPNPRVDTGPLHA
ncbi:MAG: hypothetical protein E4G99_12490 [Anaerolineales bacterium]|nr:MAG: hypothetical protein E4G99_12490 [Anaerolineales bacterium]